ncbi:hypothetical protein M3Y94_00150400 [Aphelenchoides besseyi]|nr:hypothetical protein M3Y94_00150400 [Aphelenchoides besseyi]KAI6237163.1 Peroxisomal membrane protein PEX14 [Aphelenchoides besseyi]
MDTKDDPTSSVVIPVLRPENVENARRFFTNPKIRSTPLEEQKKFLKEKGVTDAEIAAALESIPTSELSSNQTAVYTQHPLPPPTPTRTITNFAQNVLIVGGATYMAYKFVRSWVLPKFFDLVDPEEEERRALRTQLDELQNTTKFIMGTVNQTLDSVAAQQEQLNRATNFKSTTKDNEIQSLKNDFAVIKSLLLSGNNFPSVPSVNAQNGELNRATKSASNFTSEIPSWQLEGFESAEDSPTENEEKTIEKKD